MSQQRRQPVSATTVVAAVAPVSGGCAGGSASYRHYRPQAPKPVYPSQPASLLIVKRQPSGYSSRVGTLSTNYSYNNHNNNSSSNSSPRTVPGSFCCGIRWSEAGRFYLLFGAILCGVGVLTLLATGLGHHGPVWIGPIIVGVGLVLIGKGLFDYVRHRVKASADRPDQLSVEIDSENDTVDGGAGRQRRRMRLISALPFGAASARRRRRKQLAANLRYLQGTGVSGAANATSWAAGYSQPGTLQAPPRELVQSASLLLAGENSRTGHRAILPGISMTSSGCTSSYGGPREPVYFPVMSSTSRLPTPQETPFPSVFSLQDNARLQAGLPIGDRRDRLLSTRRSSGVSAPSLFDTLRPSSSSGGFGGSRLSRGRLESPSPSPAGVLGRSSRARLPLLPSQAATRLTSHKEEV